MNDEVCVKVDKLSAAISEAMRFYTKAQRARTLLDTRAEDAYRSYSYAAALRASLDLSAALVNLRK
jgi:hypothetical protein